MPWNIDEIVAVVTNFSFSFFSLFRSKISTSDGANDVTEVRTVVGWEVASTTLGEDERVSVAETTWRCLSLGETPLQ
jgi:hypothetical protein